MPSAHPPELRRRALDLVTQDNPVAQTARDLGISESCPRNWMNRDAVDAGRKAGVTSDEHRELVELHRRKRRGWKPDTATHEDLVKRQFRADAPNRLWCCDITQHRARDGWAYCAAVIDAYSRGIVGWSISDRITAEIVVDVLEMARWRRRPEPGTVVHADRGAQYTSWLYGHRLRQAGLLGSMGRVASSVNNALIESFWSTMQRELLDRTFWDSRAQLASAMFEWIEGFDNPRRRRTSLGDLSPADYEPLHTATEIAA
ncbi:IS3 family transposase [Microbacterium sp. ZXX196]|uniref:IS3 family transposase n=1 Tax=Microbacterium sp. ZXX196 TaxID=2609291 RepID=UPI0018ACA66C|nr:IS3 family transposase [Microbacterium sp. ZXX196]